MSKIKQLLRILQKDLLLHCRDFAGFVSILFFCIALLLIFHFAFSLGKKQELFAGSYWIAFFFSHTIIFQRSVVLEKFQGGLERLLLAPIPRIYLMTSKIIIHLLYSALLQLLLIPIFTIFFYEGFLINISSLLPVLFLSSLGFCALGTFVASITAELKFQEVITPLLLFPLAIPLLLASIRLTEIVFFDFDNAQPQVAFKFLCAFDAIYLIICWICYEFVLE